MTARNHVAARETAQLSADGLRGDPDPIANLAACYLERDATIADAHAVLDDPDDLAGPVDARPADWTLADRIANEIGNPGTLDPDTIADDVARLAILCKQQAATIAGNKYTGPGSMLDRARAGEAEQAAAHRDARAEIGKLQTDLRNAGDMIDEQNAEINSLKNERTGLVDQIVRLREQAAGNDEDLSDQIKRANGNAAEREHLRGECKRMRAVILHVLRRGPTPPTREWLRAAEILMRETAAHA